MPVVIRIPPTLRRYCDGADLLHVQPDTVAGAIDQLHRRFHGIRDRIVDDRGQIRGSVLVYVNEEDVRFLQEQRTPLKAGDEVSIIPAFAGG